MDLDDRRSFFFFPDGVFDDLLLLLEIFFLVMEDGRRFLVLGIDRKLSESENLPGGVSPGDKKESNFD